MKNMFRLSFIKDLTWAEVLKDWREREQGLWDEHIKERGFKDWDEFRARIHNRFFSPAEREWKLYRIEHPYSFVPHMYAGAFPGWKKYYPESIDQITFKELVGNPEVAQNPKVAAIKSDFPTPTTILGAKYQDEYVVFEGMHRAAAISLLAREDERPQIEVQIAITEVNESEFQNWITQK